MNRQFFIQSRLLFYKSGCPHCAILMKFVERINSKLPIEKRIRLVDCTLAEEFGMSNPLIDLFQEHFTGFPTIFLDGIKIDGSNTQIEAETFLTTYLQQEFINREYSDLTFNKECEKRNFLGISRIICKEA
jgi:glutaredoxin